MAQYLSAEWLQLLQDALNANEDFKKATANIDLKLQMNVVGAPEGDITYYVTIGQGAVDMALGETDSPDVTTTQDYATAEAVSKGELNAQQAFMTGKLKATGNLMKLMQHAGAFSALDGIQKSIPTEY